MNKILFVLLSIFAVSCNNQGATAKSEEINEGLFTTEFYVGTYTNVKSVQEGGSQGIYKYILDSNGQMSKKGLSAVTENPSFITKSNDNQYLLAVNEVDAYNGEGKVISYKINGDKLGKIGESSSGGAHPCHISVNSLGQVIVSNYSSGNVGLLNISKNGTLSELLDVYQHTGKGTHERQDEPHAHSAWYRRDGNGVISVDLGTNDLWFTRIENNKFIPLEKERLKMDKSAGPRHLVIHPNNNDLYILNELNNTISLARCDKKGEFTLESTFSMLPEHYTEFSKGADIHISNDGRFLYASNRGHDSIVIFEILQDGNLTIVGWESTKGNGPRNFQLVMEDKFLVLGNEKSDNIVCFERNKETGKLNYVSQLAAPAPVCLLF